MGTLPWIAPSVGSLGYSNTNYLTLGLLVQTLRHKPFAQVMREEMADVNDFMAGLFQGAGCRGFVVAGVPTEFEDPSSEYWRDDLLNGQIESTLNEMDRLC